MKTELEDRTKEFSVRIVRFIRTFPKTVDGIEVARQLLKAGTSVGANYREANRAESKDDFIHKIGISEKEASETVYWLEICQSVGHGNFAEIIPLIREANELLAIVIAIGRKAKANRRLARAALASLSLASFFFLSISLWSL